jgi:hypothetical protein
MKSPFCHVDFSACKILSVVRLQIEMEKILLFNEHTHNPNEMSITIRQSLKIDFYKYKLSYKLPFNLLELIEKDLDLEEELEKFEDSFKQDESCEIIKC